MDRFRSVHFCLHYALGYKEEIMPIRRVCKTWAKLMLTDDVWEVTLRADMFMYHKWLEYEDQRMLTKGVFMLLPLRLGAG